MNTKICSKCGQEKSIDCFEKRKDSKDGYRQYCRDCKKVQTDKAKLRWIERNMPQYWNRRAKSLNDFGSRRTGIAGEIIKNSTPLKGEELQALYESCPSCYYCNIPLEKENVVFDHKTPLSKNGQHHILNMAVTCNDCNQLKGTRTEEEFIHFLNLYIKRFYLKIPR